MPLLLFLAFVIFAGLLWDARVTVRLWICADAAYIYAECRVFYGLLPLRAELYSESVASFAWREMEGGRLTLLRLPLKKKKKGKKGAWKRLLSLRRHVRLVSLSCEGAIGGANGVFTALLPAGIIRIAMETLSAVCGAPCVAAVYPSFLENACRLKLEGIFTLSAAHIMLAALKEIISKRQGERHAASNRKHHGNLDGAA